MYFSTERRELGCRRQRRRLQARDDEARGGEVIKGTHAGKSGVVRDVHASASGHVTITVVQDDGVRFKTLARNVRINLRRRNIGMSEQ